MGVTTNQVTQLTSVFASFLLIFYSAMNVNIIIRFHFGINYVFISYCYMEAVQKTQHLVPQAGYGSSA